MKEKTKYNNYRFVGNIQVDEIQPWFDFDKAKPWDEMEVPWPLENKVRREILIRLAEGPKTFDKLAETMRFSPNPILIDESEYKPSVKYRWSKEVLENHLLALDWYNLVQKSDNNEYKLTIPVIKKAKVDEIEDYVLKFAEKWLSVVKDLKQEIEQRYSELEHERAPTYSVLIEKAVEKLYELMKEAGLLPDKPNIKTLWAEQLRDIKFEDWVKRNF
jgi:DNA-binding transcriptional ArsR family regulator